MVPIIASHRRRLLQFLVVPLLPHLHKFFFQFPEQNMYWNIAPLRSAWIFLFNESSFAQKLIPQRCNLSRRISERATSNILAISPVRVFKFIDLGCVRTGISWSFWISTFSYLYVSVRVKNLMKTVGLALELWRCWRIWFLLITNSWEYFVMPAKQFKCTIYPQGDSWE